jgi:hypothetical protein
LNMSLGWWWWCLTSCCFWLFLALPFRWRRDAKVSGFHF